MSGTATPDSASLSRVSGDSVPPAAPGRAPPPRDAHDWGAASIHPVTLAIRPPALERRFWAARAAGGGGPGGGGLAGAALAAYLAWRATLMLPPGPARVWLTAALSLQLALAAAPALAARLAPGGGAVLGGGAARPALGAARRALRVVWLLALVSALGLHEWQSLDLRRPGGPPRAITLPEALAVWMLLPVSHALAWPLAFALEAPLHVALLALGRGAARAVACAARADEGLASQARAACRAAQLLKQLALAAGGAAAGPGAPAGRLCDAAPMETLLALASALACLSSLYTSYSRELLWKRDHLRRHTPDPSRRGSASGGASRSASRSRGPQRRRDGGGNGNGSGGSGGSDASGPVATPVAADADAGRAGAGGALPGGGADWWFWASPAQPATHLLGVLSIVLASFAIAEGAASWGRPYDCN